MKNKNFNVEMEHNPSMLSYMNVKIEEDGIRQQTEDLDTQIAGKEAKTSRAPRVEEKSVVEVAEEKSFEVEEASTEEVAVEEAPAEEVVAEETPVEETKEETVVEDAPAEAEVAAEEKVEE